MANPSKEETPLIAYVRCTPVSCPNLLPNCSKLLVSFCFFRGQKADRLFHARLFVQIRSLYRGIGCPPTPPHQTKSACPWFAVRRVFPSEFVCLRQIKPSLYFLNCTISYPNPPTTTPDSHHSASANLPLETTSHCRPLGHPANRNA